MRKPEKTFGRSGPRTNQSRGATETRPLRPRLLIVCEGEKTEPDYFRLFHVNQQVRIIGAAKETIRLVEEAEKFERDEGPFEQVWCVFDRDSFPPAHYDNAIAKAQSKGYQLAYSNEAFELWFVLHFEYLNTAIGRDQYRSRLTELLKTRYKKNNPELYRLIQVNGDEERAIGWAEKLLTEHANETPYSQRCPSTTVHHLVKRLRELEQESRPTR